MSREWTEAELLKVAATKDRFNEFLNGLIKEGLFATYCVPDMLANLWMRMRMYMPVEECERLFSASVTATERIITDERDDMGVTLPDGSPVQYFTYEDVDGDMSRYDLLKYGNYEVTDDDIERFLEDQQ